MWSTTSLLFCPLLGGWDTSPVSTDVPACMCICVKKGRGGVERREGRSGTGRKGGRRMWCRYHTEYYFSVSLRTRQLGSHCHLKDQKVKVHIYRSRLLTHTETDSGKTVRDNALIYTVRWGRRAHVYRKLTGNKLYHRWRKEGEG